MKQDLAAILNKKKDLSVSVKQLELANKLKASATKFAKADSVLEVTDKSSLVKDKKKQVPTVKVVFTLPEDEVAIIDEVVAKVLKQGKAIHKSHIIRLGIQLANKLSAEKLVDELSTIEIRKVGKHLE